jgi:predicted HTH domain antitoxin
MHRVPIDLPDAISPDEARLQLAVKLFEVGKLSCGQAAELAGFSKIAFLETLGKHGMAVFNYPADEAGSDLENARQASSQPGTAPPREEPPG